MIQKILTQAAIEAQAAKGTVITTPVTYGLGLLSGQVVTTPIESEYEDLTLPGTTSSDRFAPAINRLKVQPGTSFSTRAHARSLALLMRLALGTDTTTGAGPFTHTETPAIALPYFGVWATFGPTNERIRLNDAKVDSLKLSWDETSPLEVELAALGCGLTFDPGALTVTNDETVRDVIGPIGGTLQFDVGGTSLAAEPISAGEVEISNNLEPIFLSSAINPDDIAEGEQTVEGTLTIKPNDLDEWQRILTGTAGGTTLRTSTLYGSFSILQQIDASNRLTMTANRVEFLTDFPESDPGGGAAELTLAFRVVRPTDGSAAFTAAVINDLTGAP